MDFVIALGFIIAFLVLFLLYELYLDPNRK